jgi:peptide methionine sulfoxide reductase msrA/msrB
MMFTPAPGAVAPALADSGEGETEVAERGGWNPLTDAQRSVLADGGTEPAFSGEFLDHHDPGTFVCARCDSPLFASGTKFDSGSGWPSFDEALPGAVAEHPGSDGRRTEIRCAACDGHLGHVFRGEHMTKQNTRHCVNSLALGFESDSRRSAYFAGGCFWGVEHFLQQMDGVLSVESGYMGGGVAFPTYKQVCSGETGHAEAVRVFYDPERVSFRELARRFFEIHDPAQLDRQGPDIGSQYRSAVFATSEAEAAVVAELSEALRARGYKVTTEVSPARLFWPAEAVHQDYYERTGKAPYCHAPENRFED